MRFIKFCILISGCLVFDDLLKLFSEFFCFSENPRNSR